MPVHPPTQSSFRRLLKRNTLRFSGARLAHTAARFLAVFGLGSASLLIAPTTVQAQLGLDLIIQGSDGLNSPVYVASSGLAGDDRLFVLGRNGEIKVWDPQNEELLSTPYLDLSSVVDTEGEGGLLGMAFSPGFAIDGYFYVYYTVGNSGVTNDLVSRVSRFTVIGNPRTSLSVDASSETFLSPFPVVPDRNNHLGGTLQVWGDDLYIALGDGDEDQNSQDDSTPLGKLIRWDLTQDPPPFEVVAKGLRNPYRWAFDSLTGDVYIGDVGTAIREEITVISAAEVAVAGVPLGQTAPINFGWPIEEGTVCLDFNATPPCGDPSLTGPIFEYQRNQQQNLVAVIGGRVYRGPEPGIQGLYFFGDFLAGAFWHLEWNASQGLLGAPVREDALFAPINQLVGWGEGNDGALYVVESNNAVYRVPEPSMATLGLTAVGTVFAVTALRRGRPRRGSR